MSFCRVIIYNMDDIFNKIEKKLTARNIFILLLILLLGIIFFNFFKVWSFPDTAWPLAKGEKTKINSEIIQKFTADRDGLARIKILFGDSDISPGGQFNLKIHEENCQNIIRETTLNIISLDSDNTVDFIFSQIKNSKNKTFCLRLSYAQKKGGKKANIFIADNSRPENKFLSVNGAEKTGQSIAMRPAYKNNRLWQDFTELNQRVSQYKPWFLKHYCFDFIIFGFLVLSVLLVIILIL